MRTFGRAIAIQVKGPDAVTEAEFESALIDAERMLNRAQYEQMKAVQFLGYIIDAESLEPATVENEGDRVVLSYTFRARQSRGLWERIMWAVRL